MLGGSFENYGFVFQIYGFVFICIYGHYPFIPRSAHLEELDESTYFGWFVFNDIMISSTTPYD